MKKFTIITCFILISSLVFSQKNENLEKPDSTKSVKKNLNTGLINYRNANYALAITYLEPIIEQYSNNAETVNTLAECYYFTDQYASAVKYFEKAKELNYQNSENLDIYLADSYHKNYQFTEAIKLYNSILEKTTDNESKKYYELKIQQCENGIKNPKKETTLTFRNLGENVNSKYNDYAYFKLKDSSLVVISSKRNDCVGNQINPYDGQYYEDVYFANNQDNNYNLSFNAGTKINSAEPDACVGVAKNGKSLYIYKSINNGDIFEYKLVDNKWQKTKNLDSLNTLNQETSISITKDNKYIYLVSDREGTLGKKDIFMIQKNSDSTFSSAINLGTNINTVYNEESVYINATNDTLYFSSEGHNSIGGYDIFRSTKDKSGKWQKAENLGFPYNSPNDDLYFFPSDTCAYVTTTRENTLGNSDIYVAYIQSIKIENIITEVIIKDTTKVEEVVIAKPNYDDLKNYIRNQKINFSLESSEFSTEFKNSLDSIATILIAHKDFNLKITGHTDNSGTEEYNIKLSKNRAKIVADYLITKGVDKNQITYDGSSSKQPISSNDTEEGKAKNRRVDFDIN